MISYSLACCSGLWAARTQAEQDEDCDGVRMSPPVPHSHLLLKEGTETIDPEVPLLQEAVRCKYKNPLYNPLFI